MQFVFVDVQNKNVTNFLLVAVHNEAHWRSICGLMLSKKAKLSYLESFIKLEIFYISMPKVGQKLVQSLWCQVFDLNAVFKGN